MISMIDAHVAADFNYFRNDNHTVKNSHGKLVNPITVNIQLFTLKQANKRGRVNERVQEVLDDYRWKEGFVGVDKGEILSLSDDDEDPSMYCYFCILYNCQQFTKFSKIYKISKEKRKPKKEKLSIPSSDLPSSPSLSTTTSTPPKSSKYSRNKPALDDPLKNNCFIDYAEIETCMLYLEI